MYTELLLEGKLIKHLNEIDEAAHNRVGLIVHQMAEQQGVYEAMKAIDRMGWVGMMNGFKSSAEEIMLNDLIYCYVKGARK